MRDQVVRLVREQPDAVLCTQGGGQPYGSLVALAVTAHQSSGCLCHADHHVKVPPALRLRPRLASRTACERSRKCGRRTAPGVAFGRDPRTDQNEHAVIEAVPGPCSGLVDGSVDPDHWLIRPRRVKSSRFGRGTVRAPRKTSRCYSRRTWSPCYWCSIRWKANWAGVLTWSGLVAVTA